MKKITSAHNPDISLAKSMVHAKYRKHHRMFLAEGKRTCLTFFEHGYIPYLLFATPQMLNQLPDVYRQQSYVREVDESLMAKISQASSPSGLVVLFHMPATSAIEEQTEGIILVAISDPGNMGTLIRTCVALGKKTVIIIDGADAWSPKVIMSSAGTIAQATIIETNWNNFIAHTTVSCHALVVDNGLPLNTLPALQGFLVIGNEAHGIPAPYVAQCTQKVTIEMPGNTESLNAAVAGSIAMYCAWIAKK